MNNDREMNRRDFLKGAVGVGGAIVVNSIVNSDVKAESNEGAFTKHEFITDLRGDFKDILENVKQNGKIDLEFLTTGIYAKKEHELLESGEIKPFSPYVYSLVKNCNFEQGRIDDNITSVYTVDSFDQKKLPVPAEISSFALTEIDGVDHLIVGTKCMNIDGTCGFIHYALQDYENERTIKTINEILQGYYGIYPIKSIERTLEKKEYFDYGKETTMIHRYSYENPDLMNRVFDNWTGPEVIHPDIESKPLLPYIYP
jgi:hypothetical protein